MTDVRTLTDRLVQEYLRLEKGNLVLIADGPSWDIAESIRKSAQELTATSVRIINLDTYIRPLTALPDNMKHILEEELRQSPSALLYLFFRKPGEIALTRGIIELGQNYGKVGGLPTVTGSILEAAFHPMNKAGFSDKLAEFLRSQHAIHVSSPDGTNVFVEYDHSRFNLVNSSGVIPEKLFANPIPAEVYAYPANVEGRLVIRGSYGALEEQDRFRGKPGELKEALNKTPITWDMLSSRIINVSCDDSEILRVARAEIYEKDPVFGSRIGEFGMPANLFILQGELTGSMLCDEKGRVHLAHGDGYQKRTGCPYKSVIHSDGLVGSATCMAFPSMKVFMKDNTYDLDVFPILK